MNFPVNQEPSPKIRKKPDITAAAVMPELPKMRLNTLDQISSCPRLANPERKIVMSKIAFIDVIMHKESSDLTLD